MESFNIKKYPRDKIIIALLLGILAGILFLVLGYYLGENYPAVLSPIQAYNNTGHTDLSIWKRLWSIPLRIAIVALFVRFWLKTPAISTPTTNLQILLQAWLLITQYYILDLVLNFKSLQSIVVVLLLFLSWVSFCQSFYSKWVFKYSILATLLLFISSVNIAQLQSSDNNAFSTFALIGLALCSAQFWPAFLSKCADLIILIPAIGYLLPFLEKMMLNPAGWLSGRSLWAYGRLEGLELSHCQATILSLLLLTFQGIMFAVLLKPKAALWLYPAAIIFHLLSGYLLGFQTGLNPWITALLFALAVLFPVSKSSREPDKEERLLVP